MASNELSIDELLEGLSDGNNSRNRRSNSNDSVHSSTSGRSESSIGREQTKESGLDSVQLSEDGPVERGGLSLGLEGSGLNVGSDSNNSTTSGFDYQLFRDAVSDSEIKQADGDSTNGAGRSAGEYRTPTGLVRENSTEHRASNDVNKPSESRNGTQDRKEPGRYEQENKEHGEQDSEALPELPKGITEEIIDRVVSSAWLSHMLDGSVNVDNIKENLPKNVALPKGWTVGKVLLLPHVAKKLEARGVPKPSEANILTPKQIQALTVITSARGSKWQTRLKQAGVTIAEWNSWLKQPNFRMVFDRYAEGRLKDAIPEGITALTDKAADGDLNSIKLVLEMTGRHNPNAEKDINIQAILVGIVEILQQEIHDGEALMRIVNRIKGLQTGIGIGSGHIKGEIE